jgi:hypothetical protein
MTVLEHYDQIAASYNVAWFYNDGTPYQHWLVEELKVCLVAQELVSLQLDTKRFRPLRLHRHTCSQNRAGGLSTSGQVRWAFSTQILRVEPDEAW